MIEVTRLNDGKRVRVNTDIVDRVAVLQGKTALLPNYGLWPLLIQESVEEAERLIEEDRRKRG